MSLFKDMLKENETIFKDEMVLDLDYIPYPIKFRETQQQYIATCIKPLFQNRNGKNLIITGAPGIGKTVVAKQVLEELKKETDDIVPIYINCWKKDTAYKIALEICEHIGYKFTQHKDTDALLKEIFKILNKKSAVLVLDEADKLSDFNILYSLLEDIFKKTLILITNENSFLKDLDQRILSRLTPEILEFKPYNYEETKNILKERIEYAFFPNVITEEALKLIADKTFEAKDIRSGLYLLKESGDTAELESSKKILENHAISAIEKLKNFKIKDSSTLELPDKSLLDFIKLHSEKPRKEIFDLYSKNNKISYRTFYRKLESLEKKGFVSINSREYGKSNIVKYAKQTKLA